MKIFFITLSFRERTNTYKVCKNTVTETFDDKNTLIKRIEYDEFNRDVDTKWFDSSGELNEHLHKEYYKKANEEGVIETFKNKTQEYVRKSYTKFESGLKHVFDDFRSKTGKNYINDFVYDKSGNLVKIINNGKMINIK